MKKLTNYDAVSVNDDLLIISIQNFHFDYLIQKSLQLLIESKLGYV